MTFDPDAYWISSGPYLAGPGISSPEYGVVVPQLEKVLRSLGPIKSVIDLGCGRGRIADILQSVLPKAVYTGVDIGESQVEATKLVRPDGDFYTSRLQDFDPGKRKWDLVISSEVLMHIPPDDIQAVCTRMKAIARKTIVTVDWTHPIPGRVAEWNWLHNYPLLFGGVEKVIPVGLQSIFVIRP